jgi:hypothetical protein
MIELKLFELRDAATFIPIFAFRCRPSNQPEGYLLRRSGFGTVSPCVIMGRLECSGTDRNCTYDKYSWGENPRTFGTAHAYIEEHFDEMASGQVIDVEFILGETAQPKRSEAE